MTATRPTVVGAMVSTQKLLPPPAPVTETNRFASALCGRQVSAEGFEATVREVAESLGGALLFHLGLGNGGERQCVAAVALGQQARREIAIVKLPVGGDADVVSASDSDLPVASIAQAYAGLAECWGKAA